MILLRGNLAHPGVALASGQGREGGEAPLWALGPEEVKRLSGKCSTLSRAAWVKLYLCYLEAKGSWVSCMTKSIITADPIWLCQP